MKKMFLNVKKHPLATFFFSIYLLCWLYLSFVAYYDYAHHGDGETIGLSLYYAFFVVLLPYLITTLLFTGFSKAKRKFYGVLCLLVAAPIAVILLWIFILSEIYS